MDLNIIIVNYNTKKLTLDCIKSIIEHTKKIDYEIILIDNNSEDGSIHEIENKYPLVKIIRNGQNIGYSRANNQGIKNAKGKAVLILNSDTKIKDNSIYEAWKKLKESDILTIKLIGKDGRNQQAGGYVPNLFNLFCWAFFIDDLPLIRHFIKSYQISDLQFFEKEHELDWVIGAFMMVNKQVFDRIGGFDEKIFMYGEEMEFCKRAKDAGFKIKYYSDFSVIHYGCGSSDSGEGAIIGEYRALKYFFRKHYGRWQLLILKVILKISALLRMIIFKIINSPKGKYYEKAYSSI